MAIFGSPHMRNSLISLKNAMAAAGFLAGTTTSRSSCITNAQSLRCYAFVIAERVLHFPPSARRPLEDDAQSLAA